jgi:hypothetical protein
LAMDNRSALVSRPRAPPWAAPAGPFRRGYQRPAGPSRLGGWGGGAAGPRPAARLQPDTAAGHARGARPRGGPRRQPGHPGRPPRRPPAARAAPPADLAAAPPPAGGGLPLPAARAARLPGNQPPPAHQPAQLCGVYL